MMIRWRSGINNLGGCLCALSNTLDSLKRGNSYVSKQGKQTFQKMFKIHMYE